MADPGNMEERIKELEAGLTKALDYIKQREQQQLSYPVDDASRKALGMGVLAMGTGTVPTRSVKVETNVGIIEIPIL